MRALIALVAAVALASCAHARSGNVVVSPTQPSPLPPVFGDPDDAPEIVRAWLSESKAHDGDLVRMVVQTSTNVASVEVRVESLARRLVREREDLFAGQMRVPALPALLHRTYTLQIVARNRAGRAVRNYVPVELR